MLSIPARIAVGIIFVGLFIFSLPLNQAFAQTPTPSDTWVEDSEVTSVGNTAVRARQFLDWTLNPENAKWVFLTPDTSVNQLAPFWILIRNIAYALTVAIVLVSAFLIIITRGRSYKPKKQLILVAGVFLLITFSFSLIDFIYRLSDTLQNFFLGLPNPGSFITSKDLLSVAFDYGVAGFRKTGAENEEAALVAIFLVKATAITYYVMAGILLLRKIILWFFIILSPLWVLLLPFPLVRNTAKIWMGEFFRWLFYGPLFAVLLAGLVNLWQANIPLDFTSDISGGDYPVAISILLGGPGEPVGITNSVDNVNRYAKYAFALLMLWVVILLPFLLLKIFRDAIAGMFKENNELLQKAFNSLYPFLGRQPPPPVPVPSAPPATGEGFARELTLHRPEVTIQTQVANIESLPQVKTSDIVKYAGLSVPTLRDLARMEMQQDTLARGQMMLRNIASPTSISSIHERSRFSSIQQELLARSRRGDAAATTILAAAESARSGRPVPVIVGARGVPGRPGVPLTAAKPLLMPTVNRIQSVRIDDYEDVKKMWEENYRSGDIPISDKVKSRLEWLGQDINKLQTAIELISSQNDEKKKQGLEELAVLLPFLLLGGFSDQETTIYLKAKLEAAKKILVELEQKEKEEEKVLVEEKEEGQEEKAMQAEVSQETPNTDPNENPQGEGKKGL